MLFIGPVAASALTENVQNQPRRAQLTTSSAPCAWRTRATPLPPTAATPFAVRHLKAAMNFCNKTWHPAASCIVGFWRHSAGHPLRSVTCPVCREEVNVLMRRFSANSSADDDDPAGLQEALRQVHDYNRRFSGQPRSVRRSHARSHACTHSNYLL